MSALEERHQVDLNEAQFQEVTTVGQLEKLLAHGSSSSIQHIFPTWPQHWLITALRLTIYYSLAWPATYLLAAPRIHGRENLHGCAGPALEASNPAPNTDIPLILPPHAARYRN